MKLEGSNKKIKEIWADETGVWTKRSVAKRGRWYTRLHEPPPEMSVIWIDCSGCPRVVGPSCATKGVYHICCPPSPLLMHPGITQLSLFLLPPREVLAAWGWPTSAFRIRIQVWGRWKSAPLLILPLLAIFLPLKGVWDFWVKCLMETERLIQVSVSIFIHTQLACQALAAFIYSWDIWHRLRREWGKQEGSHLGSSDLNMSMFLCHF